VGISTTVKRCCIVFEADVKTDSGKMNTENITLCRADLGPSKGDDASRLYYTLKES
jgi:hypothetical protein